MSGKKIIFLDGNNLVCRAFFALPPSMMTSTGQPTNAAYGFATMLIKLIKGYKPDQIIAAFDKGKSKRAAEYAAYKAHRPEAPGELKSQFPLIKEMLGALKIPVIEVEGEEADDILATLARRAEREGDFVYIVTNDKDVMQLVGEKINLISSKKGLTETVIYDRAGVIERFGVPPERIVDYLGLKGDPSDNIPGASGIGEKTAQKLINDHGSIEGILANLTEISSAKLKERLTQESDIALLSKRLATLDEDLPLSEITGPPELGSWSDDELAAFFKRMEFASLIPRFIRLKGEMGKGEQRVKLEVNTCEVKAQTELDNLKNMIEAAGSFSFFLAGEDHDGSIFSTGPKLNISLKRGKIHVIEGALLDDLKGIFESGAIKKITHDSKTQKKRLSKLGLNLAGVSFDPMIAAYLIDPLKSDYPLIGLCQDYLGQSFPDDQDEGALASLLADLSLVLKKRLGELSLNLLFETVELPLASVLAEMEMAGVGLDLAVLKRLEGDLEAKLAELKNEISSLSGGEFNINSPKQLSQVLFERLGLDSGRKTKTGYSTDSSVLATLLGTHPVIEKILQYREIYKLLSTYVLPLPKLVDPATGRLHTSFNQTVTATGRLSSSNPNLQNIPIRTELGSIIREAFVPARSEDLLLVADYSQIELRILAHLSGDENLIDAFNRGEDIHTFTASQVFKVAEEAVTKEMRRAAKAVNFGIIYGLSPFGLSEQLKVAKEEAACYIDRYFERYPSVKRYIDEDIKRAHEKGFAKTIFGRIRSFPELKSADFRVRSFGERLAVNFPIQGAAADIIKMAMLKVSKDFKSEGMESRMILQVHDELVFEVPPSEVDLAYKIVKKDMEGVAKLKVGLVAEIKMGHNWRNAK